MPYKKAKYKHIRRSPPGDFIAPLKTVDISHTNARGQYPAGTKAIVGKRKKSKRWGIQSVLVPIQFIHSKQRKGGGKMAKKRSKKSSKKSSRKSSKKSSRKSSKKSPKKWGKIGAPKSAKRKAYLKTIRKLRK